MRNWCWLEAPRRTSRSPQCQLRTRKANVNASRNYGCACSDSACTKATEPKPLSQFRNSMAQRGSRHDFLLFSGRLPREFAARIDFILKKLDLQLMVAGLELDIARFFLHGVQPAIIY